VFLILIHSFHILIHLFHFFIHSFHILIHPFHFFIHSFHILIHPFHILIPPFHIKIVIFHLFSFWDSSFIPGQYRGKSKPLPEYHAKIAGLDEKVSPCPHFFSFFYYYILPFSPCSLLLSVS